MNSEDLLTAAAIGQVYGDTTIETAGPHQGRIQDVGTVGGGQQDDTGILLKAIHLGQELVEGLFALIVAPTYTSTPLTADRINLVDENNAGGFGLGLAEQVPHPAGPHSHKHLDEFGSGHREERHACFAGNRSGEQGLTGSWRADQQHTFGDLGANGGETLRSFQEGDHLLKLFLGLGNAGHILEAHRHAPIGLKSGLAAAKAEMAVGHLGRTTQQQGHGGQEQGREQQIADQTSDGVIADLIAHVERYARILGRLQQQLVVTEHGHISRAPVVEMDGGQPLPRHELQLFHLACLQVLEQLAKGRFGPVFAAPAEGFRRWLGVSFGGLPRGQSRHCNLTGGGRFASGNDGRWAAAHWRSPQESILAI